MAQSPYFKADLIGGLNFCQVDGDRFGGYNKIGINGGIGISHEYSEKWTGGFEILYTSKGSKKRIDPKDVNPQIFILSSKYIEFPIIATYKIQSLKELSFSGGISVGVNIGGSVDDGITKTDANFNRMEYSLNLGANYLISENVSVRLRHAYSLFRIGDNYPNSRNLFRRIGLYNRLYMAGFVFHL